MALARGLVTRGAPGLGGSLDSKTSTVSRERRRVYLAAREVGHALHDELTELKSQMKEMQGLLREILSVSKSVPVIPTPVVQRVTQCSPPGLCDSLASTSVGLSPDDAARRGAPVSGAIVRPMNDGNTSGEDMPASCATDTVCRPLFPEEAVAAHGGEMPDVGYGSVVSRQAWEAHTCDGPPVLSKRKEGEGKKSRKTRMPRLGVSLSDGSSAESSVAEHSCESTHALFRARLCELVPMANLRHSSSFPENAKLRDSIQVLQEEIKLGGYMRFDEFAALYSKLVRMDAAVARAQRKPGG